MMLLRACPRCHGDLSLDSDIYGRYVSCLQCGFIRDVTEIEARAKAKPELGKESTGCLAGRKSVQ